MISGLIFCGVILIILGIIVGFLSGGLFFIPIALGVIFSMIFFALASILDRQEDILLKLYELEQNQKDPISKKTCGNCGYVHTSDLKSCPNCGNRED